MSASVSDFERLEPPAETLMASAESRFAAISKLTRVRVDGSRNRLMIVLPRPRRRLQEQVDDRLAAQRRHALDLALRDLEHRVGDLEVALDLLARQGLDVEQVVHSTTTSSPAPSRSRSVTRSSRAVGRFLPT
jgi:hypothetical protein